MEENQPLNIAITGSSGLVGSAIIDRFKKLEHSIVRIVRPKAKLKGEDPFVIWNIASNKIDVESLEGLDVVINLAGANIANRRWSPKYKESIYESRIKGTRLLSESLAKLEKKPKLLLSASAIGYYGLSPAHITITESSNVGGDFLAGVCADWEKATAPAQEAGIRVVHMRFGVILSTSGGALAKMLPVFKLGLGGKLGSGEQIMSWIALDEIPEAILFLIKNENISGAVNFVAPQPVSNTAFTQTLGKVLGRPTFFNVPAAALKVLLGEMGEMLLLGGQRVEPNVLKESGYHFLYHSLEPALNDLLD